MAYRSSLCRSGFLALVLLGLVLGIAAAEERVISAETVIALQHDPETPEAGRYDWGPSVMKDGDRYRLWWVRLGGDREKKFTYHATLRDGAPFDLEYPDFGDRIYYAESPDGVKWNLEHAEMALKPAESAEEVNHVGTPSVIKVNGVFYMYYEAPGAFAMRQDDAGNVTGCSEYHNQVFLAISDDGRQWRKYPDPDQPLPIIPAPESNKEPGKRRYGLGQPSASFRHGLFTLHYVDSCTGPGDFIVRIEADNPYFKNARPFARKLDVPGAPPGAVARFAQTKAAYRDNAWFLIRPAYGTGRLGMLSSDSGVFDADAAAQHPKEVFPQIAIADPRGAAYQERLFPAFLTTPPGAILLENDHVILFFSSGLAWKEKAYTWDLYRAEIPFPKP